MHTKFFSLLVPCVYFFLFLPTLAVHVHICQKFLFHKKKKKKRKRKKNTKLNWYRHMRTSGGWRFDWSATLLWSAREAKDIRIWWIRSYACITRQADFRLIRRLHSSPTPSIVTGVIVTSIVQLNAKKKQRHWRRRTWFGLDVPA